MPIGIPKNGINKGWFKKGHGENNLQNHFCKYCGKDLNKYKNKVFICSNCSWKKKYFAGLYWDVVKRDGNRCVECKKIKKINVHHKNGISTDNRLENLEALCIACHNLKRINQCLDCHIIYNAKSAASKRCPICSKKRLKLMSYKSQAKFWEKRNKTRYMWYIKKLNTL